jgi:hypothetical protein
MAEDTDALKIANDSGFPLQIAVKHQVESSSAQHGWKVRYTEHAWVNRADDQSGFIDLVLLGSQGMHLVLECKRAKDQSWVFLPDDGKVITRRQAKFWVSRYADGRMQFYGWHDRWVDPTSPVALYCSVRGQPDDGRMPMLERICGKLISATEALAAEHRDYRRDPQPSLQFYFNVIVTTAELKIAQFDPGTISLADGMLPGADIRPIPFVRFRKQMSLRERHFSPDDFAAGVKPDEAKEHTVFVVRCAARFPERL